MNIPSGVSNDEIINNHLYVLDPLTTIVKLAILSHKPNGTKLIVTQNVIYFQEPGMFQGVVRLFNAFVLNNIANKSNLRFLYNPIELACLYFLSPEMKTKHPSMIKLFQAARNGLQKLMDTYDKSTIIRYVIHLFIITLSNHIDEHHTTGIFEKDELSLYYTDAMLRDLHAQWTEEKITLILNIIEFLSKDSQTQTSVNSYVKTLETTIEQFDCESARIIRGDDMI
jgi:hypothetical protein